MQKDALLESLTFPHLEQEYRKCLVKLLVHLAHYCLHSERQQLSSVSDMCLSQLNLEKPGIEPGTLSIIMFDSQHMTVIGSVSKEDSSIGRRSCTSVRNYKQDQHQPFLCHPPYAQKEHLFAGLERRAELTVFSVAGSASVHLLGLQAIPSRDANGFKQA